jgi:hypothetical protein
MKYAIWITIFAAGIAGPVFAQEETAPVEAAPVEAAPAEAAPAEAASSDSAPAEAASDDSVPADEGPGIPLYVGAAYVDLTTDISNDTLKAKLGGKRLEGEMYILRVGTRLFDVLGVEVQGGAGPSDELKVSQYAGFYLVPTGTIAEMVEVSARIGYAAMTVEGAGDSKEDLDGVSYGVGIELPLRTISEGMPNIRLTTAGSVYQLNHDSRVFGWQVGLRYDFAI